MNASTQCPHSDLHFDLNHVGLADTNVHYLEIKARCKICEKPMVFRGLPLGLTPYHPTGEVGGFEARLPFLAEGEELSGNIVGFTGKLVGIETRK